MPSSETVWRACAECGWYAEINFYNPDAVYCEGCNQQLGETDRPVESGRAALVDGEIIDAETEETLAIVEWFDDRLEIHETDA